MLPVRFEGITATDVLHLVELKLGERKTLEYKERLAMGGREERAEFLSDISSFANASGGDILFGISEERDEAGKPTGIPGEIKPLQMDSEAVECARIEQLIESGIQPRIPVVQVKVVQIPKLGPVIIVRVGKSWVAPHMVTFSNFSRFFSRNSSTGKVQLDVQQIGAAFALQRGLGERLRNWKADRIAKAIAEEGPISIPGPKLLLHLIPATALTTEESTLPRRFEPRGWGKGSDLMSYGVGLQRYNADGFLLASESQRDTKRSYLQVFRDGALEYGDSYALDSYGQRQIPSQTLEEKLARIFTSALILLGHLDVPEPVFATLSLIGVKGRTMSLPHNVVSLNYSYESEPFDRDLLVCPDVLLERSADNAPHASQLLPLVNFIWQAAGLERTPYLNNRGGWRFAEA